MSQTLGIKFRDHGQVYFFDSGPFVVRMGDHVIVRTDQGMGLGQVVVLRLEGDRADGSAPQAGGGPAGFEPLDQSVALMGLALDAPAPAGAAPEEHAPEESAPEGPVPDGDAAAAPEAPDEDKDLKPIYRLATDEDLKIKAENEAVAADAHQYCRRCISERELDMKLVDVEVFFDRGKMIFYFTAPGRIDFRELVKDLVKAYRTRIELRQIGVRHETQMVGAVGNCGMVCCCRRYMRKFAPVTIKMAKEQNLFLNPTKISGICGRLLCCLAFEEKNYEEFYRQCPKIGKRLETDTGVVKVLRANFFRGTLTVLPEYGEEKEFSLDEWRALNPRHYDPQAQPRRTPPVPVPVPVPAAEAPAAVPAPAAAPVPAAAPGPGSDEPAPAEDQPAGNKGRPGPRRRPPRDRVPAPAAPPAPGQAADPGQVQGQDQDADASRRPRPRRRRKRKPRGESGE